MACGGQATRRMALAGGGGSQPRSCCGRDQVSRNAAGAQSQLALAPGQAPAFDPGASEGRQAAGTQAWAPDPGPSPARGVETGPPIDGRMIQPGEVTGARTPAEATAFGRRLFDLVNEERRKLGLNQVVWDDNLARIAKQSAVARDHTTHPEVLVPWGYESPEEAMWAFKQSPGHWATIIDPAATRAGGAWNDDAGAVAFGDLRFAGWEGR